MCLRIVSKSLRPCIKLINFSTTARQIDARQRNLSIWIVGDKREPVKGPFRAEVDVIECDRLLALSLIVSDGKSNVDSARWRIVQWGIDDIQTNKHRMDAVARHAGTLSLLVSPFFLVVNLRVGSGGGRRNGGRVRRTIPNSPDLRLGGLGDGATVSRWTAVSGIGVRNDKARSGRIAPPLISTVNVNAVRESEDMSIIRGDCAEGIGVDIIEIEDDRPGRSSVGDIKLA